MYEDLGYEAPNLDDNDLQASLHSGILGEQVCHVTVEQLKNASPALVTQLCVSILQKLEIDADCLGQNYMQPELSDPEHYQNTTFLAIHIPRILNQLIPGCTPKRLCTTDVLYPKWKKLRKFLSITINYMRLCDNNSQSLNEVMHESDEIHRKVEEISNHNSNMEIAIREVNDYMFRHGDEHQKRKEEKVQVDDEMKQLLQSKENKGVEKLENKQILERTKETMDKYTEKLENIRYQEEQLKLQVVTSPEKQIAEREALAEKLNQAKDDFTRLQKEVSNGQWKIEQENETTTQLEYIEKKSADIQTFFDKIKDLQANLKKQQFQTENDKVAHALLSNQVDQLKQQILDARETTHRAKLRSQKRIGTGKEQLHQFMKETELLRSQVQDKGYKIKSILSETQERIHSKQKFEIQHEETKQKLQNIETELKKFAIQTHEKIIEHMNNVVDVRLETGEIKTEISIPNKIESTNTL